MPTIFRIKKNLKLKKGRLILKKKKRKMSKGFPGNHLGKNIFLVSLS